VAPFALYPARLARYSYLYSNQSPLSSSLRFALSAFHLLPHLFSFL
jgi:hypothetical protein